MGEADLLRIVVSTAVKASLSAGSAMGGYHPGKLRVWPPMAVANTAFEEVLAGVAAFFSPSSPTLHAEFVQRTTGFHLSSGVAIAPDFFCGGMCYDRGRFQDSRLPTFSTPHASRSCPPPWTR